MKNNNSLFAIEMQYYCFQIVLLLQNNCSIVLS